MQALRVTEDASDGAPPLELEGARILLAEDEFLIALGLQMEFEERGALVTVVDSVAAGLELLHQGFDAAVLDVRLADGDVYPLADALRAAGIGFVFHSGHADAGELRERYPGADALSKPVWPTALLKAVVAIGAG
ncbi:hypothetical protein [Parvularcula dongshanensis]|uniref:CheY-like chemotaxis protein n=1 Tax=Parvularcula dongshanensis TaxID=1173995 RepID=A0A840I4D4_9PROT|nr:hypothetical protein [Parvularcula dongshanensis]MBB4659195.1 CheY-like chemotaxis protein [Parvularcula dongshanensis]